MRVLFFSLAAVVVLASTASAASAPRVRVALTPPLTVRGTGFAPHERVTVTLTAGTTRLEHAVRATAAGAFVARWDGAAPLPACRASLVVVAVGVHGDRAVWKSLPRVCGAPPQPIGQ
jgi:hypothetical protein